MADENSSQQAYIVYYEDWVGGEPVTVINTIIPNNVLNLAASDVHATSVVLSWTASTSPDVNGYDVLNGTTTIGTTSGTTYQITGLTAETTYIFTVKAKNTAGNSSNGVSLTVTTPNTTYSLSMNGTSDYLYTPVLTFDSVIIDFAAEQKAGAFASYLDASRGIPNSAFLRNSSGSDILQPAWKTLLINGVNKTGSVNSSAVVPANQRVTVQLSLPSPGKAPVYIFANQLGQSPMRGTLFGLTFTLNGVVTAAYDFTQPSAGTAVPDRSGNNQTAALRGGTWVSH